VRQPLSDQHVNCGIGGVQATIVLSEQTKMATTHANHELSLFVLPPISFQENVEHLIGSILFLLFVLVQTLARTAHITANLVILEGFAAYNTPFHWRFWSLWFPTMMYLLIRFEVFVLRHIIFRVVKWFWVLVGRRTVLGWLLEVAAAALYRWFFVPPPVAKVEVRPDMSIPWEHHRWLYGNVVAEADDVTHASVTAGGLTTSRLRRRARWVRHVEQYLGGRPGVVGKLMKGRWTPDLPDHGRTPSANVILGMIDADVKLLGAGALPTNLSAGDKPGKKIGPALKVFFVVEFVGCRRIVVPDLYSSLASYACFRPRNEDLLGGLRSRTREWLRENCVHELVHATVLPDAVELAFSQTAPERLARERLDALDVFAPST